MIHLPSKVTAADEAELERKVEELERRWRSAVARAGAVKRRHRAEMIDESRRRRLNVFSYADI